jgi:myo-inositol-1(or 4)-monophosphatase
MLAMNDKQLLKQAIQEAGEYLKKAFYNPHKIESKGDKGIVTEADKESERVILSYLNKSGYSILSEEMGEVDKKHEMRWIIDPIDGTTNFSRGIPMFSISIALEDSEGFLLGSVYNPITNELFEAERGEGAFFNGERISVSKSEVLNDNVINLSYGYNRESNSIYSRVLEEIDPLIVKRTIGTTALELCYVADGRIDGYVSTGNSIWDYAAGALIVEEAGGMITDWKGRKRDFNKYFFIASNRTLYPELQKMLEKYQNS